MSATYSQIARAFIAGKRVPAPTRTITGRPRLYVERCLEGDRLCSYGRHFPALVRCDDGSFLLNEEKYYPQEHERDEAGFRQGYYSNRDRSKMASPTTQKQLSDIAFELRRAGYVRGEHTYIDHEFDATRWVKEG